MGMANVYIPPVKPKVGNYLQERNGQLLWRIRHISRRTGLVTAVRGSAVMKVHRKYLEDDFKVRTDI